MLLPCVLKPVKNSKIIYPFYSWREGSTYEILKWCLSGFQEILHECSSPTEVSQAPLTHIYYAVLWVHVCLYRLLLGSDFLGQFSHTSPPPPELYMSWFWVRELRKHHCHGIQTNRAQCSAVWHTHQTAIDFPTLCSVQQSPPSLIQSHALHVNIMLGCFSSI